MENSAEAKQWASQVANYLTDALITNGTVAREHNAKTVAVIEAELWPNCAFGMPTLGPKTPQSWGKQ